MAFKLSEEQAENLVNAAKMEFEIVFSDPKDRIVAMTFLGEVVIALSQPVFSIGLPGLGAIVVPNGLPLDDLRFCEVLRVTANVFQGMIEASKEK